MKFAKKMKLVDYTDDEIKTSVGILDKPSNTDFIEPRILYNLDSEMNNILSNQGCTDSDKWLLYNQALLKYIYFTNKARHIENPIKTNNAQNDFMDSINWSNQSFTENVTNNKRDSLDNIKPPKVRDFFLKAREQNQSDDNHDQLTIQPATYNIDNIPKHSPLSLRSGLKRRLEPSTPRSNIKRRTTKIRLPGMMRSPRVVLRAWEGFDGVYK